MDTDTAPTTHERLLDAAGEVFAKKGFHLATVRDICQHANANVAAVNYHFRDKMGLYLAVLKHSFELALRKYPPNYGLAYDAKPEERLRAFIYSFLLRMLDQGRPAWHGKLMISEMNEPTGALDELVEDMIRPLSGALIEIIESLTGGTATPVQMQYLVRSVIGQCTFYQLARPVVSLLDPSFTYDQAGIEQAANHITEFTLGALAKMFREVEGLAG